jgi:hypothetical protein
MNEISYTPNQITPEISTTIKLGPLERPRANPALVIKIEGVEWELCDAASKHRGCNTKPGSYGRGIKNTDDDPFIVTRMGMLGEFAYAKIKNLPVDLTFRAYDDTDFTENGKTVDVKLATTVSLINRIQAITDRGFATPPKCDIYVFGYCEAESRDEKWARVVLTGWQSKTFIENLPITPSPVKDCSHQNYDVYAHMLRPLINVETHTYVPYND